MIQKFENVGYEIVDFSDKADIYVINTCTVTSIADKKSRQFLRQAKKMNSKAVIVAVGCYVQVARDVLEKIPEIDLCLGTNEKSNIVSYVEEFLKTKNKEIQIDDVFKTLEYSEFGSVTYTDKTRAVIKVQDGCDRFCSYCIIPYARGRVRSRNPESIIKEISQIAKTGIQEVVITGIHIASYGKDFKNEYKLIDLLEEINNIDGIKRIRLGSIEPLLITDDFMARVSKLEKVCHHFHLSLQSGNNDTLKRMNRRYTTEEFEKVVKRIRDTYQDAILTTDIIVGFPNETDEEFEKTYEFLKKIKFYKMHVFKYSARSGTKAAEMPNQVSPEMKEERSRRLINLSDLNETKYLKSYIGKKAKVLFEENDGEYWKGHTDNYLLVKTKSSDDLHNKLIYINISNIDGLELIGNC